MFDLCYSSRYRLTYLTPYKYTPYDVSLLYFFDVDVRYYMYLECSDSFLRSVFSQVSHTKMNVF